jgi:hypothetical protein
LTIDHSSPAQRLYFAREVAGGTKTKTKNEKRNTITKNLKLET